MNIAIIGLSFRLPGASDLDTLDKLLSEKINMVKKPSPERAALFGITEPEKCFQRGYLEDIDKFDPEYFGMGKIEANQTDPQQRMLLEMTTELLEHAGYSTKAFRGSNTAVILGAEDKEYNDLLANLPENAMLTNISSVIPAKISYFYDLHGVSMAVNSSCSSALYAVKYACDLLADMGANVIKIEVPKGGDDTRSYPPFRAKNLNGERESVYFANINRNKKGITLNLKAPEGKEIFKELVKKADIVVENYRPGVMDKLGLGYDVLKEINPRIIYAAVSGFGCYGPYHLRPGYDILAQAMGGMMSITGSKGGEPTRAGSALGDILGGLHVTIGILAAVNARTITGKGQRVDVSLMDSMIAATENTALKYIETGNIPAPMGNRYAAVSPYDSFTCKGGKVIIAAGNQKLYEKLCNEVLERPDMITDPRFVDMPGRLANQDAIAEVIEERIKDLTPNEAAELVLAHGIPAGPIMNIKEILDDPHVKEREMFVEMDHPTLGKVTVNGCAIKLMDTKPSVRTPAPQLGQNNRDIFEGVLGMTEEQFNTLHEKQVF